jgi:hypothetical protein
LHGLVVSFARCVDRSPPLTGIKRMGMMHPIP